MKNDKRVRHEFGSAFIDMKGIKIGELVPFTLAGRQLVFRRTRGGFLEVYEVIS